MAAVGQGSSQPSAPLLLWCDRRRGGRVGSGRPPSQWQLTGARRSDGRSCIYLCAILLRTASAQSCAILFFGLVHRRCLLPARSPTIHGCLFRAAEILFEQRQLARGFFWSARGWMRSTAQNLVRAEQIPTEVRASICSNTTARIPCTQRGAPPSSTKDIVFVLRHNLQPRVRCPQIP